jgi:hypothetical protein
MERISKVEQRYAARTVGVGEPFDVHPNDVRVLLALGRIVPIRGEDGYVAMPAGAERNTMTAPQITKAFDVALRAQPEPDALPEPAQVPAVEVTEVAPQVATRAKSGNKKKKAA